MPNQDVPPTPLEYLTAEKQREIRHEYWDGELVMMVGASRKHNLIVLNTGASLHAQLRGNDCETYPTDMRVKVTETKYVYPDIVMVCGEPQFAEDEFDNLLNPTLIIEVLSAGTVTDDRGRKFHAYRKLKSVQAYLMISQDEPLIEHYEFGQDGIGRFMNAEGLDATLELPSIGCTLALSDVYERITFDDSEDSS